MILVYIIGCCLVFIGSIPVMAWGRTLRSDELLAVGEAAFVIALLWPFIAVFAFFYALTRALAAFVSSYSKEWRLK